MGLGHFFHPCLLGEELAGDPFIMKLKPFLKQLTVEQWELVLKWVKPNGA